MAPKKLTDCPENLREAIDWLIQVRHGGDGQGLENLANALKKLIEGAIHKAYTTNFDALLKLLESAKSYKCCKDNVTEIEKFKEPENFAKNTLETSLESIKSYKEICYNHLDSSQQKAYDEIVSKLDQVKKLGESLNGLTDEKQCKKLLENLCTGLQTFLGFDKTSKGYDGSGIVYSDLDRLCDAVMAFLYTVLKDVYDNQPYQVGKNPHLRNVVSVIQGKLSSGHSVFKEVIDQVATCLVKYNEAVKGSNERVRGPIKSLLDYVKEDGELDKGIKKIQLSDDSKHNEEAVKIVDMSLQQCIGKVRLYLAAMSDSIAISDLNANLSSKVYNAKDVVNYVYDRLCKISRKNKEDSETMIKTAVNVLDSLRININYQIKTDVKALVDTLKVLVNNIKTKLEKISELLSKYVQKLTEWIREAKTVINAADEKVQTILPMVQDTHKDNVSRGTTITQQAKLLHHRGAALLDAYMHAFNNLGNLTSGIDNAVQDLEEVYKERIKKLARKVHDNVVSARSKLSNLKYYVIEGLDVLKTHRINPEIEKVIKALQKRVKQAAGDGSRDGATWLIQEFRTGMGDDHRDAKSLVAWAQNAQDDTSALHVALQKLQRNDHQFTNFRNVLSALESTKSTGASGLGGDNNFFGALIKDLKDKVQKALQDVTHNGYFPSVFSSFNAQITGNGGSTLKKDIDDMENFGEGITKDSRDSYTVDEKQFEGYHSASNGKSASKAALNVAIGRIKTDALNAFDSHVDQKGESTVTRKKHDLEQFVASITEEIAKVAGLVDNSSGTQPGGTDTDGVQQKLKKLRQSIEGETETQLVGIKTLIDRLKNTEMQAVVTLATDFGPAADALCNSTIGNLEGLVTSQLNRAISKIITKTRKQYILGIQELLTDFAVKVEKVLGDLPDDIERDKHSGFKGLMEVFAGIGNRNLGLLSGNGNVAALSYAFNAFIGPIKLYLDGEITRINEKENGKKNPQGDEKDKYCDKVKCIHASLSHLLAHGTKENKYGHKLHGMLDRLAAALYDLKPDGFAYPTTPILDSISKGLTGFIAELRKAYVSVYDGAPAIDQWEMEDTKKEKSEKENGDKPMILTKDGRSCAKVFLTILQMLDDELNEINNRCDGEYARRTIYASTATKENRLGDYLTHCGYKVASRKDNHDGELRCHLDMRGWHVSKHLLEITIKGSSNVTHLTECKPNDKPYNFSVIDILTCLSKHLKEYFRVCHYVLPKSSRAPCNVYEMLTWLSGLTHTAAYQQLSLGGFSELFDKPDKAAVAVGDIDIEVDAHCLEAYPENITEGALSGTLTEVCHNAYSALVAILGHGHAGGIYACDFNANPDKFSYPANMVTLICMISDILKLLYEQLYFLLCQCQYNTSLSGWRDCWYGRGVGGSQWICNDLQCPNQICDQKVDQTRDQIHNQMGDQHPGCGLKSPLQSFLEDGLPGFMPHQLRSERGQIKCSAPSHFNMPCKTPMGFTDIASLASHRQTGQHIYDLLNDFCGSSESPLTYLCSQLSCILPSAPKTLGDMFAFYYNFFDGWYNKSNGPQQKHREIAYGIAVKEAYFDVSYEKMQECGDMFKAKTHTSAHTRGDLNSLCSPSSTCYTATTTCGSYISPIKQAIYGTFSSKNRALYLSWIMYITESFYNLLRDLCKQCDVTCGGEHTKCRVMGCVAGICDVAQSTYIRSSKHNSVCNSIVKCRFTHTTFYAKGLTFGDRRQLDGHVGEDDTPKRTCKNFCKALDNVLNDKKDAEAILAKLIYRIIPDYLWAIRQNFFWTILTLWLLSLLYLLHIMVIRLDLLHITSHLHSPSSHRIAAQSLLAAARVGKLSKISYLQP